MYCYEKNVIQIPKITAKGIIGNVALDLIPIFGMVFVWEYMEESPFKELCKILLAITAAIGILYLVYRLVLNKTWFDVKDPEYRTQYIELHSDHIVIYDRAQTYGGHHYNYGKIYFEDIQYTFIHGKTPKTVYKMKINLRSHNSGKSIIKNYDGVEGAFFANMTGYPEEIYHLLLKDFKTVMKVR